MSEWIGDNTQDAKSVSGPWVPVEPGQEIMLGGIRHRVIDAGPSDGTIPSFIPGISLTWGEYEANLRSLDPCDCGNTDCGDCQEEQGNE